MGESVTRRGVFRLFRSTVSKWSDHNAPRLGAAIAYYALLSIAPLLILMVAICELVFNKATAEQTLFHQIQLLLGASGAEILKVLIGNSARVGNSILASVIALIALLFGASGVFVELRQSLNDIWDAPEPAFGWREVIWQRLVSFGMILALGILMLASLILSTVISAAHKRIAGFGLLPSGAWSQAASFAVSLLAVMLLFALIFRYVPDVRVRWRAVMIGAAVTTVLFEAGKALLAFYLRTAAVGSTYGAAGSLIAFVVWVYYSAQIFFFGAIFTRVYADARRTST